MPAEWSRRALLGSLGTIAVSGCTGDTDERTIDPTPSPSSPDTPTPRGSNRTETPEGPEPPERIDGEWPMPAHDPGRSNHPAGSGGPTDPVVPLWDVELGAPLSAPIVADGTLYVGDADGAVRALDPRTGDERWRTGIGTSAGTPWVLDDRLYVPTDEAIVALRIGDREVAWRVETPDRTGFLVAGHGVYYGSRGETSALVGLDPGDGTERWRADLGDPWEPPLFAGDEVVFVPTGTHGPEPWTFAADTGEFVGEERPEASGYHFPGEKCYLDGSVYASDGFYGDLWAFDAPADSYRTRWRATVGDTGGSEIAAGADHLYAHARGDRSLHAYAVTTGEAAWIADGVAKLVGRPVVASEAVVVPTSEALRCFDPSDGTDLWSLAGGIGSAFVVVDDLLYATDGRTVRAFRAS